MLNKLLIFSGLLCIIMTSAVYAQQLEIVAETDSFTDYELVNEDLSLLSPYEIAVPVRDGLARYQILEQSVVNVYKPVPEERKMILALADIDDPLVQTTEPGNFRGHKISSININVARVSGDQAEIVRYLKIRVYKDGSRTELSTQTKRIADFPLVEGTWYKIPVQESAIYALNREYLSTLGINTD